MRIEYVFSKAKFEKKKEYTLERVKNKIFRQNQPQEFNKLINN